MMGWDGVGWDAMAWEWVEGVGWGWIRHDGTQIRNKKIPI